MTEELKPCPFKHPGGVVDLSIRQYCECHKEFPGLYYVYCRTCGVHGSPYLTTEWAKEAWNKRT